MARVIDQVLGATTSSVVGEITRELVNASDGAGLHFADGGKIELANSAAAEFGTADFSIEFVLNQTGDNTSDNYIYTSHTPGNNRLYIWNDISANKVNLEFVDGSASASTKVLDYDMSADYGTVTHYVITCDRSGNATLYKNGNSVATVDISSTSSIDIGAGNTNVGALSAGAGYGVLGTFYRFRTWNKSLSSAEVQTAYERADVPVADQYGSQTEKVANSGLENWNVANTVPDDWPTFTAGSSAIARSSDAASGSYSAQLSVDSSNNNVYINTSAVTLPAGKTIRYSVQMKGSTAIDKVSIYALGDNVMIAEPALTTSYQTFTGTYTATADSRLLIGRNSGGNGASKSIFVDNASVVQIGCVSDYDLAFANPTQSLTVQDRSGAADGTASASGVTQVQPIIQGNLTSLAVGSAGLPAGVPADNHVFIGDTTTTPLAGADDLIIARGSNDAGVTIRTATTATGQICFADGNTGNEQYRGFIGYAHGTDKLNLGSGGSTRLTIDSSGTATISKPQQTTTGTPFSGAALKLLPPSGGTTNTTGVSSIALSTSVTDNYGFLISGHRAGTDGTPTLRVSSHNNSNTGTEVLTIDSTGQTSFAGHAVPATNFGHDLGTSSLKWSNVYAFQGNFQNGITFTQTNTTATGATATGTTLDHYEEGTWTPSITTGAGESITYANQVGKYTRIGDIVTVSGYIKITSSATYGSSTHWLITGLPFGGVSGTTAGGTFSYGAIYNTNPLTTTTDISAGQVNTTNGTSIYLSRGGKGGTSDVFAKTSALNTTGTLTFSLVYKTADA